MRSVVMGSVVLSMVGAWTAGARAGGEFEVEMFLELNETDQDAEIVMEINSEDPMLVVAVVGPGGLMALLNLIDPERLGQSEILLESAEPSIDDVLLAYPEGTYSFFTLTTLGEVLSVDVEFTHDLLAAPPFEPADGALVDPDRDLVVDWDGLDGAASYVVEVESEDSGISVIVEIPASLTSFRVPKELLLPGLEYQVGVGVKTDAGNFSVGESTFRTEQ